MKNIIFLTGIMSCLFMQLGFGQMINGGFEDITVVTSPDYLVDMPQAGITSITPATYCTVPTA